jgi:hypothetical protein
MYRMKGNRDAAGQLGPVAVLPFLPDAAIDTVPIIVRPASPRAPGRGSRLAWTFAAGLGVGMTAFGIAGLTVAATRSDAEPTLAASVSTAVDADSEGGAGSPSILAPMPKTADGPPAVRLRYVAVAGDTCESIGTRFGFAEADGSRFAAATARLSGLAECAPAAGTVLCIPAGSDLGAPGPLARDDACMAGR